MAEAFTDADYWGKDPTQGMNYGNPRQCRAFRSRPIPEGHVLPEGAETEEREGGTYVRCGRLANFGQFVCASHGGNTTHAKTKAQELLQALVDPAIRALDEVLMGPTAVWVCLEPGSEKVQGVWKQVGYSMTDKLRAVREVLDRVDLTDDQKAPYLAIHEELVRCAKAEARAELEDEVEEDG